MNGGSAQSEKRLLFVVNVAWFFTSHRLQLAIAARNAGYIVHVAATVESLDEGEKIRSHGFPFHEIRGSRDARNPISNLLFFADIFRVISAVRPQLVHAVTAKPIICAGVASRILHVRGFVGALTGLGHLFVNMSKRSLLRYAVAKILRVGLGGPRSRLIVQNANDRQVLLELGVVRLERVVLIPGSGVDLRRYAPSREPVGKPLIILPARILRDKGVVEFCQAALQLREAGVEARFALVGGLDSHNPAGLSESEVRELSQRTGVEWWGARDDMPAVFAACHIVCLPSYREGLPRALVEAAATGRAIVTSDVPGCRDVVEDGKSGLLVPPRDANALAVKLKLLIGDANLREVLGTRALERAISEFDILRINKRTLEVYDDALA